MTTPEKDAPAEKPTLTRETVFRLAAGGVLAVASYLAAGFFPRYVFYLAYIAVLIAVAYSDYRTRLIPNRIIYPAILVALGAMFHFPDWGRFPGWGIALLGGVSAALFFVVPVFIYGPEQAGIGDVKLAFFIGLIFGVSRSLYWALLVGFVSTALVGLVGILLRKMGRKSLLPYGPFLALGAIALLITQMVR